MIDLFEEVLYELSASVGVPFQVDYNYSCAILVDERLKVQIEPHKETGKLIIGTHVALLDPGKFRENVLKDALRANNLPYPQVGIFGYQPDNNQLALFDFLEMQGLRGERLADYLTLFSSKALEWKDAIESGKSAPSSFYESIAGIEND